MTTPTESTDTGDSQTLAALDLGSNSFHMVVAEQDQNGQIRFIDRVKEMVRLNAGLDEDGNLSEESQLRALDCLQRFSQRLRGIPAEQIRVVGTNTFRAAHNADVFLARAEEILGHNIAIISGREEARLVYLGAAFSLESSGKQRLVIDIGGGSTELIVGKGYEAMTMNSLYIGCVSMSRRFFADGQITQARLRKARAAVSLELEPIVQRYRQLGWDEVVGTSGTIRAVDDAARALGLNQDWITQESFSLLEQWLVRCGHVDKLENVNEQRRPVFPGGFAIIAEIFSQLELTRLDCANGALREGVLYDLNGRLSDRDSRNLGVDAMVFRYGLDREQSKRVQNTCMELLDAVAVRWKIDSPLYRKLLGWACQLHEIGVAIAFNQNHKHGAYIIENTDIDGFSRQQQRVLGLLVRSHRQKFPMEYYQGLVDPSKSRVLYLAILLRLSYALNRGRVDTPLPDIVLEPGKKKLTLRLPDSWARNHPLTIMDLESEVRFLNQVGFKLRIQRSRQQ